MQPLGLVETILPLSLALLTDLESHLLRINSNYPVDLQQSFPSPVPDICS
jgi:hypothetical protein